MKEKAMTRHKFLLNKVSSFQVVLSLFVCKGLAYDIESAMKIATVGPNVYLGSKGIRGTFAIVTLEYKAVEKFPIDQSSWYFYQL